MNYIKSERNLINKSGGGRPAIYRSEDYAALSSGSTQEIEFTRETSSFLLHNRNAYGGGNLYCKLGNAVTADTPVVLAPGEMINLEKAWITDATLYSDADNPAWQLIITL